MMQMDRDNIYRNCKCYVPLAVCLLLLLLQPIDVQAQDYNMVAPALAQQSGNLSTPMADKILTRRKRYLAFPEGSSVSAAICMTIGMIGNPNVDYLSWAVNWGVAYTLPNHNWVKQHVNGFPNKTKAELKRRSRRSFYEQVQLAFDHMGFDGHACVARALCESAKYLQRAKDVEAPRRKRGNMIEEIVRTIFSLPRASVGAHEPFEHHQYDHIYRRSRREVHDCTVVYPGCHFSLLELALGKYPVGAAEYSAYNFM